jgi:hypothetical protein
MAGASTSCPTLPTVERGLVECDSPMSLPHIPRRRISKLAVPARPVPFIATLHRRGLRQTMSLPSIDDRYRRPQVPTIFGGLDYQRNRRTSIPRYMDWLGKEKERASKETQLRRKAAIKYLMRKSSMHFASAASRTNVFEPSISASG